MWMKLQWARFFTLAGWNWSLSPRPGFDFKVTFPCVHGECNGSHTILVRVVNQSYHTIENSHAKRFNADQMYNEPHPALFGDGPENTYWQMAHGSGGGVETVGQWVRNAKQLWERASHE